MILVFQLNKRSTELSKVLVNKIGQLFTCQDCLLLKNADIAPGIDYFSLNIPKRCITKKICIIMKETRRTDHLSVAGTFDIHHLCRFRTQKHDETVLLLLFLLSRKRNTSHKGKHRRQYILQETHQDYSVLRNFSSHPSRSNTQSLKRGSMTIYVVLILDFTNSSIASLDLALEAWSRRRV